MALIRRVSRLFTADMHAVLDQIEEPEAVLRQAIREMEEELARQRQRRKWLDGEIESAAARADALDELRADLDAKLDLAFASDNESLARRLTRRKLETVQLAEAARANRQALSKQRKELEALLEANADRLEGMQQKSAILATDDPGLAGTGDARVSRIDDDDVEIAFLREKQARATS
jgi:phage shock protein A